MADKINKLDCKERVAFELFQRVYSMPQAEQQRCLDMFHLCVRAVNGNQVDLSKDLPKH